MSDTPPDRLCNDPRSPYFNEEALARDVGIRFKGVEKTNVEEYCVSEGWIRVAAGNAKDRFGNPADDQAHRQGRALFQEQEAERKLRPPKRHSPHLAHRRAAEHLGDAGAGGAAWCPPAARRAQRSRARRFRDWARGGPSWRKSRTM